MKLIFKLAFTFTIATLNSSLWARDIVVVTYKNESENYKYFVQKMHQEVTEKLVKTIQSDLPCEDKFQSAILHICFDEKDQINLVRQNIEVLQRSLSRL